MKPSRLSVCIPVFNEEVRLPLLVRSILDSQIDSNDSLRVLLYLDGCTDSTASVLSTTFGSDSRVYVQSSQERRGKLFALNQLSEMVLGESFGSHVLLLDSDSEVPDGVIKGCFQRLHAARQVVVPRVCPAATTTSDAFSRWADICFEAYHQIREIAAGDRVLWFLSGNFILFSHDAFTHTFPISRNEVINDDFFIGWRLLQENVSVVYAADELVYVPYPRSWATFFRQKWRVRVGHTQLAQLGLPIDSLRKEVSRRVLKQILYSRDLELLLFYFIDSWLFFFARFYKASPKRLQKWNRI